MSGVYFCDASVSHLFSDSPSLDRSKRRLEFFHCGPLSPLLFAFLPLNNGTNVKSGVWFAFLFELLTRVGLVAKSRIAVVHNWLVTVHTNSRLFCDET